MEHEGRTMKPDAVEYVALPPGAERWNRAHRGAYLKGTRAALAGEPVTACPYEDRRKDSGSLSWSRSFIRAWEDGWHRVAPKPIKWAGDSWRVLGIGAHREDGTVYVHLASLTRSTPQKNGNRPIQIGDWLPCEMVKEAK